MHFLKSLKDKLNPGPDNSQSVSIPSSSLPPQWAPAREISHKYGLYNEAPENEHRDAERFCDKYPPQPSRLIPSDAVDQINRLGCKAWGIEAPITPRFIGSVYNPSELKGGPAVVKVQTEIGCKDVCLLSDLPIIAGLYDIQGKIGVYYEILIHRMDGIIAIGTACRPYPAWRLPGWNRLSAGLHLDDFRKFFEDPDGGRDYIGAENTISGINSGDTVGCGYEYASGELFFTYNGIRLPPAFTGIYLPRHNHDVFAAIGVEGHCEFEVNFGGEYVRWKEGNEWAWRVEGHVGQLSGGPRGYNGELPPYSTSVT